MTSRYVLALALLSPAVVSAAPAEHRTERVVVDHSMLEIGRADNLISRTIYLNRCRGGCTIPRGQESATGGTSSIINVGTAYLTEFAYSDQVWNDLVECVKETYAPFNIVITDERPASGTYWMNVVAGVSTQVGYPEEYGILGVSPSDGACPAGFLNNTITFSFVNDSYFSNDVNAMCWVVAQETAHSFGLDHEALAGDAMTYIGLGIHPASRHEFLDQAGQCGATQPFDDGCYCGQTNPTQNSYQMIHDIFGGSCESDEQCEELGDGLVCAGGDCVAGPGEEGGLGEDCDDASACESGQCTQSSEGSVCTVDCDPDGNDCPSGFSCLANGNSGVCWPGGGGGCCSAGGETPTSAIALGFGVLMLVMRRRRAR